MGRNMKRFLALLLFGVSLFAQRVVVVHSVWGSPGGISLMNVFPPFSLINGISPHGATLNKVIYSSGHLFTVSSGNGKVYIFTNDNIPNLQDSIEIGPMTNPYSAVVSGDKILVSLWAVDSLVSYDINTKNRLWGLGVWRSPQYVGYNGNYYFAISTGYNRNTFTTDTSIIYKIDILGNIVDSLKLGINLLYMDFLGGDSAIVSGGDFFTASTWKIYIISTDSLAALDSVSAPASFSFVKRVNGDTVLALSYFGAYYYLISSRAFIPLPLGSYYGFSEGEVYNERLFILAAGNYTSNGDLIVFNRNTNSIEHVATVEVGPISITLSPTTLSSREYIVRGPGVKGIYDVSGRKVDKLNGKGVYFVVDGKTLRRVVVR
jgi:hypothetical protein